MTITVYSKPACVQCTATTRALDRQGLDYRIVDVSVDDEAFATVQGLGYRQVPSSWRATPIGPAFAPT